MKIKKPSMRFYPFPLFVVEVIGTHYRSFSLTIRFKEDPSAEFVSKFLQNKPPFFRKTNFVLEGRELTVTVGKILSELLREDRDRLKALADKNQIESEDAFDYIVYIPGFKSRKQFNNDVDRWLNTMHLKCPIEFVIRDETDMSRHRYPGAEWCNLSEHFDLWNDKSIAEVKPFIEGILNDPSNQLLKGDERKIFSYSIKALDRHTKYLQLPINEEWDNFIITKSVIEKLLSSNDRLTLADLLRKNATGSFTDITLYVYIAELIHTHFGRLDSLDKIAPETVLWVAEEMYAYKDAWEIAFGDGYRMSLVFDIAIANGRLDIIEKIRTFIIGLKIKVSGYMYWFYHRAQWALDSKKIREAFAMFQFILSFDFMQEEYVNRDLIAVFPGALFCITERNTGMKASPETIEYFLSRCLPHAESCGAIYEKAALLYIQRREYGKAVDAYQKAFTSPKVKWPHKTILIHTSAYCNALWLVLKENSHLDIDQSTIDLFITVAHEFAEKNPAVYTNLSLVYAQQQNFEKAKEQFLLSRERDVENFTLLESEINSMPSLQAFKIYLGDEIKSA